MNKMHKLPRDAAFDRLLERIVAETSDARFAGKLPEYAVFVDRLFKQMPLYNRDTVVRAFAELLESKGPGVTATELADALTLIESPDGSALHAAVGCAGEGGELLDAAKKVFVYGKRWDQRDAKTNQTPLENVLEELADFRFYYQKLLNMLGITDAEVLAMSYSKLTERYASGFYSDAQAQARADKANEAPSRKFIGYPQATGGGASEERNP